jgi:hypothetical protein
MEAELVMTFINTVGFPAAAFFAMYYLVSKIISKNTEALHELSTAIAELNAKE